MSPTGHLAVGFAAKRLVPELSIFIFLVAAYVIDFLYFIFLAVGIDTIDFDPWSHSLVMAIVWSFLTGLIVFLVSKKLRSGLILGLVAFSHWILDVIVWDNIPIAFDPTQKIGLGLFTKIGFSLTNIQFNSGMLIATSVEMAMLAVGLVVYISYTKKMRKQHKANEAQ